MTRSNAQTHEELLEELSNLFKNKLPHGQGELVAKFARQYYANVALEDLLDHDLSDLYGAVLSHWGLVKRRQPGESIVRVYNPQYEEHGWQSTHTIIEISHDDMPFLVDSLAMEINRMGYVIHLIVHYGGMQVVRDKDGITEILLRGETRKGTSSEAPLYFEIDRHTDAAELKELEDNLQRVLHDVRAAVEDWQSMREKVTQALEELEHAKATLETELAEESEAFLRWVLENHFTFLGYREYELVEENGERALAIVRGTGLGLLREEAGTHHKRTFSAMPAEALQLALSSDQVLIISKTNSHSTIHRPAYTDYIGVKRFNEEGQVIGERRFIGLYTSAAYNTSPKDIPFLRHKVQKVVDASGTSPSGHAQKALLNILETLPRDELFQASPEELRDLSMGILQLQERRRVRVFARKDVYGRSISCLVYVPREEFNTGIRNKMQSVLQEMFEPKEINFSTYFSESVLARIHFTAHLNGRAEVHLDQKEIESRMVAVARRWEDDLHDGLIDYYGEERGTVLLQRYYKSMPVAYQENFSARTAVYDIEHCERLSDDNPIEISFYHTFSEVDDNLRAKLFQRHTTLPLSDVLPMLENMGLRVLSEVPYELKPEGEAERIWMHDFCMSSKLGADFDIAAIKDSFKEAFSKIWQGQAENDGFNRLVLSAKLHWRQVAILRAVAKYLKQTGFTFSQRYIEETLGAYPKIAGSLVTLFYTRFDPNKEADRENESKKLTESIIADLESVANLDQDRIMRRMMEVINATLRTNYFQRDSEGRPKQYMSFKLDPIKIPELPKPLPCFEIFVYSPRFEGVHLRGGKVARGGLRWSDRREDFRTEILGLVKAQQVKNAVIVPVGAKGGFVPKCLPTDGDRDALMSEAIGCYQNFIRGLLDLTDNIVNDEIVPPENLVRYDEDDPYLVVAADKGTATFSDIANAISEDYGFWLGDAFASGGSVGYDHKKMGITAKGAWESVKRNFRELGIDTQSEDFTVVGIGDMAGDVFGNGMLLSEHIRLVAAFNHMHIFIDPSPDAAKSFEERKRLFELPRSTWMDYNQGLISQGGGIFRRTDKAIRISPEMKSALNIRDDFLEPNELIKAILRAPVDLLWNGGIGTYVKASHEIHIDAGDRTNDLLRVDATELNCRVVGEGGNLGLTQNARIEFELNGGIVIADFIDNSAGVDCSDHEVNIKILLNQIVQNGDMTEKQRNELLAEMTDEVGALVLHNNYSQALAISMIAYLRGKRIELFRRYIQYLERCGEIDRELEFLPTDKVMSERRAAGLGLTRPEIAVLLAYSKIIMQRRLLASDLPEDPYLQKAVFTAFPKRLKADFENAVMSHSLRREIISTQVSNYLINHMGVAFAYRLYDETGADMAAIIRAFTVAEEVFNGKQMWQAIEALDHKVDVKVQLDMINLLTRLLRRATRWFLRNRRAQLDIEECISHFGPHVLELSVHLPNLLGGEAKERLDSTIQKLEGEGVPRDMAQRVGCANTLFSSLDIIEAANNCGYGVADMAQVYFAIGEELDINWFRELLANQGNESHWDAVARAGCRDDLDWQQRSLALSVLSTEMEDSSDIGERIKVWVDSHDVLIDRWRSMLIEMRTVDVVDYPMMAVALRQLLDLVHTSLQQCDSGIFD